MTAVTSLELHAGEASATIAVDDGARVSSLEVAGLGFVGRGTQSPHGWGSFPMAPWAGRVRNGLLTWDGTTHQLPVPKPPHAIHGLVASRPWTLLDASSASARLTCDLGAGWPWPGHVELRYDLAPDSLTTWLAVHAAVDTMPAWCGHHPWFNRRLPGPGGEPVEVAIELRAHGMLVRDGDGIATTVEVPVPAGAPIDVAFDDCFTGVSWPVVLTWPGVARLEVAASTDCAVVFTERDAAACVEPQTAPPDAAALGLAGTAAPGSPHVLTSTWRWSLG